MSTFANIVTPTAAEIAAKRKDADAKRKEAAANAVRDHELALKVAAEKVARDAADKLLTMPAEIVAKINAIIESSSNNVAKFHSEYSVFMPQNCYTYNLTPTAAQKACPIAFQDYADNFVVFAAGFGKTLPWSVIESIRVHYIAHGYRVTENALTDTQGVTHAGLYYKIYADADAETVSESVVAGGEEGERTEEAKPTMVADIAAETVADIVSESVEDGERTEVPSGTDAADIAADIAAEIVSESVEDGERTEVPSGTDAADPVAEIPPKYILQPWLQGRAISWVSLSYNPHPAAIELLRANPDKIDWEALARNASPGALELMRANPKKINWTQLCFNNRNPDAIEFLKLHPRKISWPALSRNPTPNAVQLLMANHDLISWDTLSSNAHPDAVALFKTQPEKIDWERLSVNESDDAVKALQLFPTKINWAHLSGNRNPIAMEMLRANPDKIDWLWLAQNEHPDVMDMFAANPGKLSGQVGGKLFANPGIFVLSNTVA